MPLATLSDIQKLGDLDNKMDPNRRMESLEGIRDAAYSQMDAALKPAEARADRKMLASERRQYDAAEKVWEAADNTIKYLSEVPDRDPAAARGYGLGGHSQVYEKNMPLKPGQTFAGYFDKFGEHAKNSSGEDVDLSFSKLIRGAVTGDWRNADAEKFNFQNSMGGGTDSAGGFLVPTTLTSQIIDLARPQTRVLEAGATLVPMATRTVEVPKWASDPTPGWRGEGDAIATSDASLAMITLTATSLAVITKVTRELVEDTDIEGELAKAFAAAFAARVDYASLYGSGTSDEPTGIKTHADVVKTSMGANGATPSYDTLVDAVGRLRDANEDPTAQIANDRTARTLAKLKDSAGNYLQPPDYLDDVPLLSTNQIPVNLTQGTANNASDIFTGDFKHLYIGVRGQLKIDVLKERYMDSEGSYGFLAWWRGDIQVARPAAFDVTIGVKP